MFFDAKSDILSSLLDITKIQITDSSNKIEGIVTAAVRLKEIVSKRLYLENKVKKRSLATVMCWKRYTKIMIILRPVQM